MNLFTMLLLCTAVLIAIYFAMKFIGGDLTVVGDWRKAWRFYSVWAFAVVGILPDAYNAIVASGMLGGADTPEYLTWSMRAAAIGGILLRLVKQVQPPIPDDTDGAGA